MKNPLKRKQKPTTMAKENKFSGKRQHNITDVRAGMPQTTLVRLEDLHELLQCDPDSEGYVITTFKEMQELTHMDVNLLTLLLRKGMMIKATTGASPKFKYKWDTIEPTLDMAVALLKSKIEMKNKNEPEPEDESEVIVDDKSETLKFDHLSNTPVALIDYHMEGDMMIMRINTDKFNIKEEAVINAVLAVLIDHK